MNNPNKILLSLSSPRGHLPNMQKDHLTGRVVVETTYLLIHHLDRSLPLQFCLGLSDPSPSPKARSQHVTTLYADSKESLPAGTAK